jgi:hypothetical protein
MRNRDWHWCLKTFHNYFDIIIKIVTFAPAKTDFRNRIW